MKRFLKWTAVSILGIVVVATLAILGVSEYRFRETFDVPATPIVASTDSIALARGRHLYATRGCEG